MKMKNVNKKTKLKAFSMNEVLIVLVIVGILSTIAIVGFGDYVGEAYRLEAKSNLKAIKTRQDNYHMTKLEYSSDLSKLRFKQPAKEVDGGTSVYTYEIIEADKNTFIAQATADKDYDGDGVKEVLTINQEGLIQTKLED